MFLHLRPDKIESEGFSELEGGGLIFFKGYVIHEDKIISDQDFLPILASHYLNGELASRIKTYNGNFIFLIIRGNKVIAANDRYGIYPLFYTEKENQLIISTRWQRLVPFSGNLLHRGSVMDILSLGYVLGSKTLVENIHEFPTASLLETHVQSDRLETTRKKYWKLEHRFARGNVQKLEKEFAALWRSRIALYTDYIKEHGNSCLQLLSGGLDSRLLAHEFDQAGIRIHAITYGLGKESGEVVTARKVMEKLANGGSHKVFYNDQAELQKIVRSNVPYDRITNAKNAEKELYSYHELDNLATMRVPGYSGDFMAGSHIKYRMKSWQSKRDIINYILKFHVTPLIRPDLAANTEHRDMLIQSLDDSIGFDTDPISAFIQWDLDNRQRRYIVRSEVEDNEGPTRFLLPFFDNELIDFFLGLPMEALLNTRLYTNAQLKYLYKSNPELIRIKRDNDRRQQLIRNNLVYEYRKKLKHMVLMYQHRKNTSLHTNWSPDIEWQKEISSWDLPALVNEFHLNTENISGAYITYLLSLAKLKKELAAI
jgi:asparagine synthase (glutamine-hydrolysing)